MFDFNEFGSEKKHDRHRIVSAEEVLKLAYKAYRENHPEKALNLIKQAKEVKTSSTVSLKLDYLKGDVLLDMKRFKEAVDCYSKILIKEKTEIAFCNKALCLWELKRFNLALKNYLKAIELNSANEITHRGAGEMYLKLNRLDAAAFHFQKAVQIKPNYIDALIGLGIVYFNLSKWRESYDLFRRVLEIDPADDLAEKWLSKLNKVLFE